MARRPSILVIKLGALGDLVQALGPMAAIRAHHSDAVITLLTTAPFVAFAQASPYVDTIWTDSRPRLAHVRAWLGLRRQLRHGRFERVYDLQTSDRSGFYYRLFWPGPYPQWVGIARGCSHPHANPYRDAMHTVERQAEQLRRAGIERVPPADLTWAQGDPGKFGLAPPYALIVAGGAPHRLQKRWPAERFAELSTALADQGIQPVLLGAASERPLQEHIRARCPAAVDLAGKTSLLDLAGLARAAAVAVGNDTGPMHMAAAAGCPCVVLFSDASDPALCGQRGPVVRYVHRKDLGELDIDVVIEAVGAATGMPAAASPHRDRAARPAG